MFTLSGRIKHLVRECSPVYNRTHGLGVVTERPMGGLAWVTWRTGVPYEVSLDYLALRLGGRWSR